MLRVVFSLVNDTVENIKDIVDEEWDGERESEGEGGAWTNAKYWVDVFFRLECLFSVRLRVGSVHDREDT